MVGSSVWLTHSLEPHTTVTIKTPSLRLRPGSGAEIVAAANGDLANKEPAEHSDLGAWI